MPEHLTIRRATVEDASLFCEHIKIHLAESGHDDLIFHPTEAGTSPNAEQEIEKTRKKWQTAFGEAGSEVVWIALQAGQILGHVDVRTMGLESARHRLILGIGLQKSLRGQGVGRRLMQTAIDWARENKFAWIDLKVFSHNLNAIRLYRSFGFTEAGTTLDMFRVQGQSIDDIHMVLKLENRGA